jgi:hypothetical protein
MNGLYLQELKQQIMANENLTHWKKAFKSDYLSSSDIDDKDLILTISKVVYQECVTQSGKKFCNVAHFKEANVKPMILNVGNSKIVKKFSGNKVHLEEWVNIPIRVYVKADVKFGSDTVEGLRITETQPKTIKPELLPDTQQWTAAITFLKSPDGTIEKIKAKYVLSPDNETLLKSQLS